MTLPTTTADHVVGHVTASPAKATIRRARDTYAIDRLHESVLEMLMERAPVTSSLLNVVIDPVVRTPIHTVDVFVPQTKPQQNVELIINRRPTREEFGKQPPPVTIKALGRDVDFIWQTAYSATASFNEQINSSLATTLSHYEATSAKLNAFNVRKALRKLGLTTDDAIVLAWADTDANVLNKLNVPIQAVAGVPLNHWYVVRKTPDGKLADFTAHVGRAVVDSRTRKGSLPEIADYAGIGIGTTIIVKTHVRIAQVADANHPIVAAFYSGSAAEKPERPSPAAPMPQIDVKRDAPLAKVPAGYFPIGDVDYAKKLCKDVDLNFDEVMARTLPYIENTIALRSEVENLKTGKEVLAEGLAKLDAASPPTPDTTIDADLKTTIVMLRRSAVAAEATAVASYDVGDAAKGDAAASRARFCRLEAHAMQMQITPPPALPVEDLGYGVKVSEVRKVAEALSLKPDRMVQQVERCVVDMKGGGRITSQTGPHGGRTLDERLTLQDSNFTELKPR